MINKNLKKNSWIVIVCFLLTLLPLGAYSTDYGIQTLQLTAIWMVLYLFTLLCMRVAYSFCDEIYVRPSLEKFQKRCTKILFDSNELKFRAFLFFSVVALAFMTGWVLFDNLPMVGDDMAQYTHARLLTMGRFSVSSHPLPEFFPMVHVITEGGKWYSQYQLGHLLPLALGHILGIVYLVDPIMCGMSALLLYIFALDNYGKKIARITAVLTVLSIEFWYMGSSYMNHNTSFFGCVLFVWAFFRLLKKNEFKYSIIAGFGIGLALITRPISAVGFALPFVLYALYKLRSEPLRNWLLFFPAGMIAVCFIAWQLYFNLQTTGDPLIFGPQILYGDSIKYGFGHEMSGGAFSGFYYKTSHTLWRGIGHFFNNTIGLNYFLFNWPIPSLVFVFSGLLFFRIDFISKLMLSSWLLLGVAYIPYFYQDWYYGPRYMHESIGFLIVLTALGISRLPATLRVHGVRLKYSNIIYRINILLFVLSLFAFALFFNKIPRVASSFKYPDSSVLQTNAEFPDNSLVFLNRSYYYYTMFMPPLDSNRVIYAMDLGEHNQKLIDYYKDRSVFIEKGSGFQAMH